MIAACVACPFIERNKLLDLLSFQFSDKNNGLYKTLFICQNDMQPDSFVKWWNYCLKDLRRRMDMPYRSIKSESLSSIIGQHMASMASVKEGLPTLSSNITEQIDTLILSLKQLECINSPTLKKLIQGPFGSGKSMCGQAISRNLYDKLTTEGQQAYIFYVICANYSLLAQYVKRCTEKCSNNKVKLVCGSLHELYQEYVTKDLQSVRYFLFTFHLFRLQLNP